VRERDHYEDLGVDVGIILKRIFKNTISGWGHGLD
jgi:hypothetical protein